VRLTGGSPLLLSRVVLAPSPAGDLIAQSLEELTPEQRDVLALAAILGSEATTGELRAMVGGRHADVVAALDAASARGLIERRPGGWAFTHELVQRAAGAFLTAEEVMDAHVVARDLAPFDDRPPASARRAYHALAAAERSDSDARRAIAECRTAARLLARGFDYERAVELLASAVELAERVAAPADRVEVLLEHADALLVVGRLPDARRSYERADDVAAAAEDPIALARAALGLGGVWVNEIRDQVDRVRMLARQRTALEDLPVTERGLRARLRVRLAAEAVYDGAPVEPVLDALDEARCVEDPRVLTEALSLAHHALLAPEHLERRRKMAAELIVVATGCGDDLRVLFGLLWTAVDEFLAGDPGATRTLSELRTRADAVGCRSIGYIVAAIDVMLLIRAGRLDEAEAAADACFELGMEVGDSDATGYYGAHIITIRWLQDRDCELLDLARDISGGSGLIAPEFAFRAATASMAARAGLRDEAATILATLTAGGLDALPPSSTWLTGIVNIVEAASLLGDRTLAADGARVLAPFADRPVMPSLAVTCFGSVERALGVAAMTSGDADGAIDHLERAVNDNVRIGNRPMAAICRADLAAARLARDEPGDRAAAAGLLRRAANSAAAMAMTARAERWRCAAATIAEEIEAAAITSLRHDDGGWVLEHGGRHIELGELVGAGYLATLVSRPGVEVPAIELCGGAGVDVSFQTLIDPQALGEYRSRVAAIDAQLGGAGDHGPRRQQLEREREALRDELAASLARSGRSRRFTDPGERARTAVRKAIARVLDVVERADPGLAHELRAAVTTGRTCAYRPAPAHRRVVVEA
jgi:tetratricopeptide (TPR) repeat protein